MIYDCQWSANQRWTWRADGTVVGEQSGLCLDVAGAATSNTARVLLWTCHGAANQRWSRG
ncbi:ricin-type beta-trefoil lectin domain protein [Micromonospora sp. NPDC049497]|uniref:ricin-type beta-trefoil lectin domain protein n=1 Tax=Micromonospora sp. NPDC049497 TaxID=3364273 RepID=UPI0037B2970F